MAVEQTLLQIVQTILSDIEGDEINTISDTPEGEQVARLVKGTYLAMVSHTNWPHTRRATSLTPRADSAFPTHMTTDDDLKELISVRYNTAKLGDTRKQYKEIEYLPPDDFLRKINARDNDSATTDVVIDDSGIELLISTNKAPQYYTSFDDKSVIFDSYDSEVDSTLQQSKLQAQGYIIPDFNLVDTFVPNIPIDALSFLIEESTSKAQLKLRQFQDIKSEREAQKQSRWLSRKSWVVGGETRYPNYGRKTR